MRTVLPDKLEQGRVRTGRMGSDPSDGGYGAFNIHGPCGEQLVIVASAAASDDPLSAGWEHVSVSIRRRCPNWTEMSFVKNLFWSEDECVVQFHPPRSEHVNNHPNCLHLWRHKDGFPMPPSILVGDKSRGELTYEEAVVLRKQLGL